MRNNKSSKQFIKKNTKMYNFLILKKNQRIKELKIIVIINIKSLEIIKNNSRIKIILIIKL